MEDKKMTTLRRILSIGVLAAAYVGISAAGTITYTATPVTNNTDFGSTFTLQDFNLVGQTLTGVTLTFTGSLTTTQLILQNQANTSVASGFQTFAYSSTATLGAVLGSDSADPGLDLSALTDSFVIKNTGTIGLGGGGANTVVNCSPVNVPSASCNTVNYAGLANIVNGPASANTTDGNVSDYIGTGTFTIGANTVSFNGFSGGGNNIQVNQTTTGTLDVAVTYTYQPTASPEPATLFLMGSALVGVGILRKRMKA